MCDSCDCESSEPNLELQKLIADLLNVNYSLTQSLALYVREEFNSVHCFLRKLLATHEMIVNTLLACLTRAGVSVSTSVPSVVEYARTELFSVQTMSEACTTTMNNSFLICSVIKDDLEHLTLGNPEMVKCLMYLFNIHKDIYSFLREIKTFA